MGHRALVLSNEMPSLETATEEKKKKEGGGEWTSVIAFPSFHAWKRYLQFPPDQKWYMQGAVLCSGDFLHRDMGAVASILVILLGERNGY